MIEGADVLEVCGLKVPERGPSGGRVVGIVSFSIDRPASIVRIPFPMKPARTFERLAPGGDPFDDADYQLVELTESEYQQCLRNYEKRVEEWRRTCGTVMRLEPRIDTATFACDDGTECTGQWTGDGWAWREWHDTRDDKRTTDGELRARP